MFIRSFKYNIIHLSKTNSGNKKKAIKALTYIETAQNLFIKIVK